MNVLEQKFSALALFYRITGEAFKTPDAQATPRPIKSESLWV